MSLRRIVLLGMLVALGICAAMGVIAVFFSRGDYLGRVLGTAVDTVLAAALLVPLAGLVRREKLRLGAVTGMGVALAAWACVLAAIWGDWGMQFSAKAAFTAGMTCFMGVPAALALMLISVRQARQAVIVFVGGAAAAWVLCECYALLEFDSYSERIMQSGLILYGLSTVAALLLVNVGCGDRRYFRWAGLACAGVGMGVSAWRIWGFDRYDDYIWRLDLAIIIPAIVMAHVNVVLMAKVRAWQQWITYATCGMAALCGTLALISVMRYAPMSRDLVERGSSAAGVVAACGALALVVLTVLNRKGEDQANMAGALQVSFLELICPRCNERQQVSFGESACRKCQLQFSIKVTEPRCPACGYLLYRLTGPRCPECGASIAPAAAAPDPVPEIRL